MATQREEIEASIADLEQSMADAPPEMKPILQSQIDALRGLLPSLDTLAQAIEANKAHRPSLSQEISAYFQPEQPAQVPAWLPDNLERAGVHDWMLHCAPGAQIYASDSAVGCAFPAQPGSIPVRHGLTLFFHPSGRLSAQRCYDQGLLRWDVSYHASGGRASQGFYCDRSPSEQREHGLHTSFSPAGTIVAQTYFHDGVRHGWSRLWEDDGFPISATLYQQGQPIEEVWPDGQRKRLVS